MRLTVTTESGKILGMLPHAEWKLPREVMEFLRKCDKKNEEQRKGQGVTKESAA